MKKMFVFDDDYDYVAQFQRLEEKQVEQLRQKDNDNDVDFCLGLEDEEEVPS
jgi:hypothetical protein